jgi:outer membrane protein assembly factor BamA
MNVSGSLGVLRSFGRDANRRTGTRVIDRFFLGGPDMTGFDIAGVGPRGEAIRTSFYSRAFQCVFA